jgi:carboxypeptidase family protein
VFLGLVLGGVMLLLGRGLLHSKQDARVAVPVTQTRPDPPPLAATIPEMKSTAPSPAKAREPSVAQQRGYKVAGRVFDESSGAGVANASINYYDFDASIGEGRMGQVTSNQDGSFVLEGIPRGRFRLTARSPERAEREVQIVVSEHTPAVEIGLAAGGTISGFLTLANGTPASGSVTLVNERMFDNTQQVGEDGVFSFEHLAAGRYLLHAREAQQEITLAANERREGVVLRVRDAGRAIRGTVTGLRREELGQVLVMGDSFNSFFLTQGRLNARGEFVLNGFAPGRADLRVQTPARMLRKQVEVPADKDLVVTLGFAAGVRLSGRVTQGDQPVGAGKAVLLGPAPPEQQGIVYVAQTAADGTYRLEGIEPGEYEVSAAPDTSQRVRIANEDVVLDVAIPVAQLSGRVIDDSSGEPIMGVHVYAPPVATPASGATPADASDDLGHFHLTGVKPGQVVLSAYKGGYELYRERIDYSSPLRDLTIKLRPSTGVELKAHMAESGAAVRELQIIERPDGGGTGIYVSMQLDENGIGALPRGLAGSTLEIHNTGRQIVVRDWDGQPLDLKFP